MSNELQGASLSELMQQGKELTGSQQSTEAAQQTQEQAGQDAVPAQPVLPPQDDEYIIKPTQDGGLEVEPAPPGGYEGPGLVIETTNKPEPQMPKYTGISPDTMSHVEKYTKEMEEEIERQKKMAEEIKKKQADAQRDPSEIAKENEDGYNEAIVIIDKVGMGQIINFTEEERRKLERVKKIKLEEVETVELASIKSKRAKKGSLPTILKRQQSALTTPIILPASGYTAVMKGCSTYELISLMASTENKVMDNVGKWSLIHEKIVTTSIGEMDFDTFLKETASIDYNNLIYGLLCSTYPEDDKIPIRCPKCNLEHEHHYSVRSLIRAEKMSDKLKALIMDIADNSHTAESAKAVHARSAVNLTKSVKLPQSGIVAEIYVQSAFDLIYKTIKGLEENTDPKLNQASIMSTAVKTMFVPDPDDVGGYLEYDEAIDITQIIYSLQDTDLMILTNQTNAILEDITFDFGLMNVQCPNEKCRHFEPVIPFDIETILFYRYQQAMSTKIE